MHFIYRWNSCLSRTKTQACEVQTKSNVSKKPWFVLGSTVDNLDCVNSSVPCVNIQYV